MACSFDYYGNHNSSLWPPDPSTSQIGEFIPSPTQPVASPGLSPNLSQLCLPGIQEELTVLPPSCFYSTIPNEISSISPTSPSPPQTTFQGFHSEQEHSCSIPNEHGSPGFTYVFGIAKQPFVVGTIQTHDEQHQQREENCFMNTNTNDERQGVKNELVVISEQENSEEHNVCNDEEQRLHEEMTTFSDNKAHLFSFRQVGDHETMQQEQQNTINFNLFKPDDSPNYATSGTHLGTSSASGSDPGLEFEVGSSSEQKKSSSVLMHKAPVASTGSVRKCRKLCQSEVSTTRWWSYGSRAWGSREDGGIYVNGVLLDLTDEGDVNGNKSSASDIIDKKKPSRFCHICLRRAERVTVIACGHIFSGQCRKVICKRCFKDQSWDWGTAITKGSGWVCPHCRNMCPDRAQCFNYSKTNNKRHIELMKKKAGKKQKCEDPEDHGVDF